MEADNLLLKRAAKRWRIKSYLKGFSVTSSPAVLFEVISKLHCLRSMKTFHMVVIFAVLMSIPTSKWHETALRPSFGLTVSKGTPCPVQLPHGLTVLSQKSLQPTLIGVFSMLSFSNQCICTCVRLCMYICIEACDTVSSRLSLSSESVAVTLAKQFSVYLWPGDLYPMWLVAFLQALGLSPASPWPSFSTLPLGTVHYSAPASHPWVWMSACKV